MQPGAGRAVGAEASEPDQQGEKRRRPVWYGNTQLQEDGARPIIYHWLGATSWRKEVKGFLTMVNSLVSGWRFEDVWLDR